MDWSSPVVTDRIWTGILVATGLSWLWILRDHIVHRIRFPNRHQEDPNGVPRRERIRTW